MVERGAQVGEGSIVSGIAVPAGRAVPDGVAIHGCPLEDGRWVCRVYGVEDNPKESSSSPFLGATLDEIMERTGVSREDIWSRAPASIWNAEVYPVCETREGALDAALSLCRIALGTATADEVAAWRKAPKASLSSSFDSADVEREARDACSMEDAVRVARFTAAVAQGAPSAEALAGLGSGLRLAGRLGRRKRLSVEHEAAARAFRRGSGARGLLGGVRHGRRCARGHGLRHRQGRRCRGGAGRQPASPSPPAVRERARRGEPAGARQLLRQPVGCGSLLPGARRHHARRGAALEGRASGPCRGGAFGRMRGGARELGPVGVRHLRRHRRGA